MVTMAQSAAIWGNTHTHMDRTHSLTHTHTLTSTQLQPRGAIQQRKEMKCARKPDRRHHVQQAHNDRDPSRLR